MVSYAQSRFARVWKDKRFGTEIESVCRDDVESSIIGKVESYCMKLCTYGKFISICEQDELPQNPDLISHASVFPLEVDEI